MAAKIFGRGMVLWCRGFTQVGSSNVSVQMDLNHLSVAWHFLMMAGCCCRRLRPTTTGCCVKIQRNLWVLDDVVGGLGLISRSTKWRTASMTPVVLWMVRSLFRTAKGSTGCGMRMAMGHLSLEKSSLSLGWATITTTFPLASWEHEDRIYGTPTAIYFNNTIKADQVEGSVVFHERTQPQKPRRGVSHPRQVEGNRIHRGRLSHPQWHWCEHNW